MYDGLYFYLGDFKIYSCSFKIMYFLMGLFSIFVQGTIFRRISNISYWQVFLSGWYFSIGKIFQFLAEFLELREASGIKRFIIQCVDFEFNFTFQKSVSVFHLHLVLCWDSCPLIFSFMALISLQNNLVVFSRVKISLAAQLSGVCCVGSSSDFICILYLYLFLIQSFS